MLFYTLKGQIITVLILVFVSSFLLNNPGLNENNEKSYMKGIRYYSEKNYEKALKFFNKMEKSPDIMIYLKCKSYYHLKKYKEVISLCTNQLKNNYLNEMKRFYEALSYHKIGNYDLSIKTASTIKEKDNYIKFLKYKVLEDYYYDLKE